METSAPGVGIVMVNAQAESDVTIGLHSTQSDSAQSRTFDIIFGAHNNTCSLLRNHERKVLRTDKRHKAVFKIPQASIPTGYGVTKMKDL